MEWIGSTIKRPFELVMIQPTSHCNINCKYCYLSLERRKSKNIMKDEVIDIMSKRIFNSSLIHLTDKVNFLWHAGEPLSVPINFYENAISIIQKNNFQHKKIKHSVLTNGIAVNDKWCELFNKYDFEVGVSVDGPKFLHDVNRRTWNDRDTFELVIRGINTLKANNIHPYALTTIHLSSLNYPKELYKFYKEHGINRVGFNFEEVIGHHLSSSLQRSEALQKAKIFIDQFYKMYELDNNFFVREFDYMKYIIMSQINLSEYPLDTITPFSILTIDTDGNFSTFSPELADVKFEKYKDFVFGNLFSDSFESVLKSDKLNEVYSDIKSGVSKCRDECEYFDVCGATLPAHKLTENGSFESTHTMNCNISIKLVADIITDDLIKKLQ